MRGKVGGEGVWYGCEGVRLVGGEGVRLVGEGVWYGGDGGMIGWCTHS